MKRLIERGTDKGEGGGGCHVAWVLGCSFADQAWCRLLIFPRLSDAQPSTQIVACFTFLLPDTWKRCMPLFFILFAGHAGWFLFITKMLRELLRTSVNPLHSFALKPVEKVLGSGQSALVWKKDRTVVSQASGYCAQLSSRFDEDEQLILLYNHSSWSYSMHARRLCNTSVNIFITSLWTGIRGKVSLLYFAMRQLEGDAAPASRRRRTISLHMTSATSAIATSTSRSARLSPFGVIRKELWPKVAIAKSTNMQFFDCSLWSTEYASCLHARSNDRLPIRRWLPLGYPLVPAPDFFQLRSNLDPSHLTPRNVLGLWRTNKSIFPAASCCVGKISWNCRLIKVQSSGSKRFVTHWSITYLDLFHNNGKSLSCDLLVGWFVACGVTGQDDSNMFFIDPSICCPMQLWPGGSLVDRHSSYP